MLDETYLDIPPSRCSVVAKHLEETGHGLEASNGAFVKAILKQRDAHVQGDGDDAPVGPEAGVSDPLSRDLLHIGGVRDLGGRHAGWMSEGTSRWCQGRTRRSRDLLIPALSWPYRAGSATYIQLHRLSGCCTDIWGTAKKCGGCVEQSARPRCPDPWDFGDTGPDRPKSGVKLACIVEAWIRC
jgi:hypothetical protein